MESLLQLKINKNLKDAIKRKAKKYGVPSSSLIRIVLTEAFLEKSNDDIPGNVFNAERDNKGEGIPLNKFLKMISS